MEIDPKMLLLFVLALVLFVFPLVLLLVVLFLVVVVVVVVFVQVLVLVALFRHANKMFYLNIMVSYPFHLLKFSSFLTSFFTRFLSSSFSFLTCFTYFYTTPSIKIISIYFSIYIIYFLVNSV